MKLQFDVVIVNLINHTRIGCGAFGWYSAVDWRGSDRRCAGMPAGETNPSGWGVTTALTEEIMEYDP
jgi:hypothetical protein